MTGREPFSEPDAVQTACRIVRAYISANALPADGLEGLIVTVHETVLRLRASGSGAARAATARPTAAEIEAALGSDGIMSFENGKRYKALRRHLSGLGLSPEAYRRKWGLPSDFPMTCPSYSKIRTAIARNTVLGRRDRSSSDDAA